MLRRVSPVDDFKRPKPSTDPQRWTDAEMLHATLPFLSNTLPATSSSRRTLAVYFHWIEVHRCNPTSETEDWGATLMQWAQDLKDHGLEKEWLINAVREYKDRNGIKDSPIYGPKGKARCLPMAYDILKAFEEKKSALPKNTEKYRQEDFLGTPPGNYVCNRCGTAGHFLEACPTNMDPSYDLPPNMNYQCPVCFHNGLHYKSLCPKNTDPFCIIEKRRAAGIHTPGDHLMSTSSVRETRKEEKSMESDSLSSEDIQMFQDREAGRKTTDWSTRTSSPDQISIMKRRLTNETSPSPSKSETLRKKILLIKQYEAHEAEGGLLSEDAEALISRKEYYQARLDELEGRQSMMDGQYGYEKVLDSPIQQYRSTTSAKIAQQSLSSSPEELEREEMNMPREDKMSSIVKHSDFIKKLMESHPSMKEVVNPARRVKTAASMWIEDDMRRRAVLADLTARNGTLQEILNRQEPSREYKYTDNDVDDEGEGFDDSDIDQFGRLPSKKSENITPNASGWS